MKVKWVGKKGKIDITQAVASTRWEGSVSQAARTAEIAVVNAPNDKNITQLKLLIAVGDIIELHEEGLIFLGEVITKEITSETGTVTFSCMDFLNHLLKSTGTYNFRDTTAERITRRLWGDFLIKTGEIIKTNAAIKKLIIDGNNIYDIIIMAYTKAALQTGKKYICRMKGDMLEVVEKGFVVKNLLEDGENITNITQEETIENMVNLVKIYNDKKTQIGEVKESKWIKQYGIYQQVYQQEKGISADMAAKAILHGIEKKLTLDGIEGDVTCIAGNGVNVRDKATNLNGLFWIERDTHTWENGIHTMSLELNFKNIMDQKEEI